VGPATPFPKRMRTNMRLQTKLEYARLFCASPYLKSTTQQMGRTQRRLLRKTVSRGIDSSLDARLRLLAVGQLDRKSQDQLFIELAKNPGLVDRLAEHLRALSPL
ncbi:MAG: hypothetical protein WAM44_03340, partial [Chthoniobacterales bacterium]